MPIVGGRECYLSMSDLWLIVPDSPILSAAGLLAAAILLLYLGRRQCHQFLKAIAQLLFAIFRSMSQELTRAKQILAARNHEVVIEQTRAQLERKLERDFHRIYLVLEKDLAGYPELQREIHEQITIIEEDYQNSAEVPPPTPDWVNAVTALASQLDDQQNKATSKILEEIHETSKAHKKVVMEEYRDSVRTRHKFLHTMLPHWRTLNRRMESISSSMEGLFQRAREIDQQMDEYEVIRTATDESVRSMRSSALSTFFIASIGMVITVGGILVNYNLIALPMAEITGGAGVVMGYPVYEIAAMVVVFVQIGLGLCLMDALRITRIFPVIGYLDDRLRRRLIWVVSILLVVLASLEGSLAFIREHVQADMLTTRAFLSQGEETVATVGLRFTQAWVVTVAHTVMGLLLPLALVFAAIPFEGFMRSGRVVLGDTTCVLLDIFASVTRILGVACVKLSQVLVNSFDLIIALPLFLEDKYLRAQEKKQREEKHNKQSKESVPLAQTSIAKTSTEKPDEQNTSVVNGAIPSATSNGSPSNGSRKKATVKPFKPLVNTGLGNGGSVENHKSNDD